MKSLEDMKIYIIDDDISSINLVEALLTKKDYRNIKTFTSPVEGFDLTQKEPPDLIILDIIMPEMNGFEFCTKLRASKITSKVPVIMITGGALGFDDALRKTFEFEFMDFISKPVQSIELIVRVKSSLELKHTYDCMQQELNNFRESEGTKNRLLTAIEQSDQIIIITDENGRIEYTNPAFENITGYSKAETLGQNPRILKSNKQNDKFYKEMWNTLSQGKAWKGHLINKKKDGSLFEEETTISPVKNNLGKIINYVAAKHDVTEARKIESQIRQLQKMQSIGVLAGGIAHDFNNILGIITANSEIALEEVNEDSESHYSLNQILKAALRAKKLVSQIFAFSRNAEVECIPLNLSPMVKESIKFLKSSLPKNIEIRHNLIAGSASVMCNPDQIHQVFMNICTNAVTAMDGNKGILSIGLQKISLAQNDIQNLDPGPYLKLSISDTGHGIPPENLDKIFDSFFTDKTVNEASGLGLSVVHGIIKNLEGEITVASTEGKGSEFNIILPCIEAEVPEKLEKTGKIMEGKECILLVDDEKMLADVTGMSIKRMGYETVIKTDPEEALKTFEAKPEKFDLVITDKNMPKMNGLELIGKIQKIRPEMPVLLCTGLSEKMDTEESDSIKISGIITKPVSRKEMGATIRKTLDKSQQPPA